MRFRNHLSDLERFRSNYSLLNGSFWADLLFVVRAKMTRSISRVTSQFSSTSMTDMVHTSLVLLHCLEVNVH